MHLTDSIQLTKHHGLGNDFLVMLGESADGDLARRLCDRHRGIGADGLIQVTRAGGLRMVLFNADGSRAEMSGNGIRCLAQAVVDAGWAAEPSFTVATDAGDKRLDVGPDEGGVRQVRVDMGTARVESLGEGVATLDLGNPHEVRLVGEFSADRGTPPVNIEEIVAGPEPDALTMRVWERGVGETQACGTGACAAAVAAHRWGLVGPRVTVHQLGGDAVVEIDGDHITLSGPTEFIASIEVLA
jgi:diaminopimelate epimerase